MFEIDQGSGFQRQAPGAPSLKPGLGYSSQQPSFPDHRFASRAAASRKLVGRRTALWMVLAVLVGAAGLWCRLNIEPDQDTAGFKAQFDSVARLAGFGIDMVVLTGHRMTADTDIFEALDLPHARSLVSFDTDGVRRRLERLPWVLTADLTRVFPGRLDVRVSERKAFAVWIRDGRAQLIDGSGRVLGAINRADGLDLPRVSGEGAGAQAERLITILARYPDVYERLEVAERIAGRRWTLHLSGGVSVLLPPEREAAVLETLSAGGRLAGLLYIPSRIIDVRAPGRIAVRQTAGRSAARGSQAAIPAVPNAPLQTRPDAGAISVVPAGAG